MPLWYYYDSNKRKRSSSTAKPEISTITCSTVGQNATSSWTFPDTATPGSPGQPQIVDVQIVTDLYTSGDYIAIWAPGTGYVYYWFLVDGMGCPPGVCGPMFQVDITSGEDTGLVRDAFTDAVNLSGFFTASPSGCGDSLVTGLDNTTAYSAPFVVESSCGNYSANIIQFGADSVAPSGNGILSGDYITFYTPTWNGTNWTGSTAYHVWFNVDAGGGNPGLPNEAEADINSSDSGSAICGAVVSAINVAYGFYFSASAFAVVDPRIMHLQNTIAGAVTGPATTNGGIDLSVTQTGTSSDLQSTNSSLSNGSLILLNTPTTNYFLNFLIGGFGNQISIAGRTRINVSIQFFVTASSVATAIFNAVNSGAAGKIVATHTAGSAVVTLTNVSNGPVTDLSKQQIGSGMTVAVTQQGSN